jgi:predicted Zn-dependent protease
MIDLKLLLSSIDIKADWVGLRAVTEHMIERCARNGNFEPLAMSHDEGIMVEVLVDGQFACAGTMDISQEGVQQAAKRAFNLAQKTKQYRLFPFDKSVRPPSQGSYTNDISGSVPLKELNDLAIDLSNRLKINDTIINTRAMLSSIHQEISFVSTNGANYHQTIHMRGVQLLATAQVGTVIQTRTNGFPVVQGGDEFFNEDMLRKQAQQVAEEAIALCHADECPTGEYDLILMPDQLYLQIHESIGHPLEIDRILGDERNYAGWSFVKPEDFGKLQYGSNLLNITFDPTVSGELASYKYDDTGAPATREYLIREGLLMRGLGGLESQKRSNLPGVANMRATSWNRPPIDRMANINLEPDSSKLEDMISATQRGILMKTNRSWSIDDYRNKFQFGCEYAQLIEDGKLTKVLKNPNYRGVTTPFWHKLKMVGNAATHEMWGSYYCGKGEPNQVIRVGHATPACLFEKVEVFGGGA